jgi:hypothetical protein
MVGGHLQLPEAMVRFGILLSRDGAKQKVEVFGGFVVHSIHAANGFVQVGACTHQCGLHKGQLKEKPICREACSQQTGFVGRYPSLP